MVTRFNADQIQAAVAKAEAQTDGEIVPVVVRRSSEYTGAAWRGSFAAGLLAAVLLHMWDPLLSIEAYFCAQILGMVLGAVLIVRTALLRWLAGPREIDLQVNRRAMQIFFERGVHQTRGRSGILLYLSILERRAILIADSGIHARVQSDAWTGVIQRLLDQIRAGHATEAVVGAVQECGAILAQHFPPTGTNPNELSDQPEILDRD